MQGGQVVIVNGHQDGLVVRADLGHQEEGMSDQLWGMNIPGRRRDRMLAERSVIP